MNRWILLAFCLLLGGVHAAEPTRLDETLTIEPLSPTLWQFRASHSWEGGKPIEANGLFVMGESGIAMIDTGWTDSQAATLIDWIEAQTSKRVRYVVATHWHWDRMGGMAEVNRRGIRGVALERSAVLGLEHQIAAPAIRFHDLLEIDLGNRSVELYFPGGGHTEDNIVVWLEADRLLFGGCMVKSLSSSIGYLDDATLEDWEGSLQRVAERYPEARRLLPGHGEEGDLKLLDHTAALVRRALNVER